MTTISGFTFIHNSIESGYPIVEAIRAVRFYVNETVVVDMASTDGTRGILEALQFEGKNLGHPLRILNGHWGNEAGETLRQAHKRYIECEGDIIVHFEGDEVYEERLIRRIVGMAKTGYEDMAVFRLQLEQNFQRCRWYPELVHRVFPRISATRKEGHTTDRHDQAFRLEPKNGFLWDITNCFRDNWLRRVAKQAELWHGQPKYVMTPIHATLPAEVDLSRAQQILGEAHWTWTETPFRIPDILKPLVGATKYEPKV